MSDLPSVPDMSKELPPKLEEAYEFPILRTGLIELIKNEKDFHKVRQIFGLMFGMSQLPESQQMAQFESDLGKLKQEISHIKYLLVALAGSIPVLQIILKVLLGV